MTIPNPCCCCNVVIDHMDKPNGTTVEGWTERVGDWQIENTFDPDFPQLTITTTGAIITCDTPAPSLQHTNEVSVVFASNNSKARLIFDYVDNDNFKCAEIPSGGSPDQYLKIFEKIGGVETEKASGSPYPANQPTDQYILYMACIAAGNDEIGPARIQVWSDSGQTLIGEVEMNTSLTWGFGTGDQVSGKISFSYAQARTVDQSASIDLIYSTGIPDDGLLHCYRCASLCVDLCADGTLPDEIDLELPDAFSPYVATGPTPAPLLEHCDNCDNLGGNTYTLSRDTSANACLSIGAVGSTPNVDLNGPCIWTYQQDDFCPFVTTSGSYTLKIVIWLEYGERHDFSIGLEMKLAIFLDACYAYLGALVDLRGDCDNDEWEFVWNIAGVGPGQAFYCGIEQCRCTVSPHTATARKH